VAMSLSVVVIVEVDKWMRSSTTPVRRTER